MKMKSAFLGLAAIGGIALTSGSASAAMPNGLSTAQGLASGVEQVRLVCDVYGRCFRRPSYYAGPGFGVRPRFYGGGPRYYGGGPRFYGGGGPRFYGGGGYGRF